MPDAVDSDAEKSVASEYSVLSDGTLEITGVSEKHAGVFKCVGVNVHGTSESEGTVDLVGMTPRSHFQIIRERGYFDPPELFCPPPPFIKNSN